MAASADEKDAMEVFEDDAEAFESLERDFHEVVEELAGNETLDKFRDEYVKLHEALRRSHENERRLYKKVRDLNEQLARSAAQVASTMQLGEEADADIDQLTAQVEKAYERAEAEHAKAAAAEATAERLRGEVESLTAVVTRFTETLGEDTTLEQLIAARDRLGRQTEELKTQLSDERERAESLAERLATRKDKYKALKEAHADLGSQLRSKEDEERRETTRQRHVREEMDRLRETLRQRERDLEELRGALEASEAEQERARAERDEAKEVIKKTLIDVSALSARTDKYKSQLEHAQSRTQNLQEQLAAAQKEARRAAALASRADAERRRALNRVQQVEADATRARQRASVAAKDVSKAMEDLGAKEREVEVASKKLMDAEMAAKRAAGEVERGAERLRTEAERKKEAEAEAVDLRAHTGQQEKVLQRFVRQQDMMRSTIMSLERHIMSLRMQAETKDRAKEHLEGELKLKDAQIAEAEKRETEAEGKLKKQRQTYDRVRADRNLLSKQLIEAQDEIAELRRKFKIMARQVDQLKEDIAAKDRSLVAMHFDNKAAAKRLDDKAHECDVLRGTLAKSDANVKQLTTVVDELNASIRKLDEEAAEQRRKVGQLVTERDILGAQLVRRNDELALLYEKVDIQGSVLRKGEAQYSQRLEDIRVLKLEVGDLRRTLALERRKGTTGDELRREVARLQRDLLQESTKVKALSEELENPMNVHRWRRLEGSDPATFELIQKVQTLQKRLISKTEQVVERDLLLADKEKMYLHLKDVLKRQAGPEVAERLSTFQQALRGKTRQLRSLAAELNMQQALAQEYKFEVERLHRELQAAKRKYFAQRRREAIAGQRTAAAAEAAAKPVSRSEARRAAMPAPDDSESKRT